MGLFKKKNDSELDNLISLVEMNMSNNYKDEAQKDYARFLEKYQEKKSNNELNNKQCQMYDKLIDNYNDRLKGYSHKDQKPFWTGE